MARGRLSGPPPLPGAPVVGADFYPCPFLNAGIVDRNLLFSPFPMLAPCFSHRHHSLPHLPITDHLSGVVLDTYAVCCWVSKQPKSKFSPSRTPPSETLTKNHIYTHKDNTAIRTQNTLLEYSLCARCVLNTLHIFNPRADAILKNGGSQGLNSITDTDWGVW